MTIVNGRRERIDVGPASGLGHFAATRLVNVPFEDDETTLQIRECPTHGLPIPAGRIGCSPRCARNAWGRRSVG